MITRRVCSYCRRPLVVALCIGTALLASGCLWGVVRDASSGAPVGGATIRYADSTGQTGTTTADANGIFSFDQSKGPIPAAGPVNFAVDAPGYEPVTETRQVGLSGAQNFDLAPEPGTYSNAKWRFSIKFPEDWMVQEGEEMEEGAVVVGIAPPEDVNDEFSEVVIVMTWGDAPEGLSLEMFFQLMMRGFKESGSNFKQLEDGEATINGREARWAVFSMRQSGVNTKSSVYFLLSGERAYMILCTDESTQFLGHRGELEEIASSLRIY